LEPGEAQQAKDAYEEAEKALKIMTEGQPNLDYAGALSNFGEYRNICQFYIFLILL
jgi:hypothetical protein